MNLARPATGRRRPAFDLAVAAFATGVEFVLLLDDGSATAAASALTVVAGGALVARRAAPLAVLGTTLAAAIALAAIDEAPSGLTVLIALYTTALVRERSVSLAALAPTTVATAAISVATASGDTSWPTPAVGALTAAMLTVGIWGLGAYAQTRRRYQRELEERAVRLEREREQLTRIAVHEERASIARELHDIVAHSVSVMLVGVRGARDVLHAAPDVADETLARVETTAEQSLIELRRILDLLREPDAGAESRPQPSLAQLHELVGEYRRAGLPVSLAEAGERRPLSVGAELSVYRIVQEALTNALKHARATSVIVTLVFHDRHLEVEIVDDGVPDAGGSTTRGQGLVGMRERVALLDGELEAGHRLGGGFRVAARVPLGGAT